MGAFKDLTGNRYGRLVVHKHAGFLEGLHRWICRCDCGKWTIVITGSLSTGNSKSCGCLNRENVRAATTFHGHGRSYQNSPEYSCYYNMIARCVNPKRPGYSDYGGRGIIVCDRWRFGEDGKRGFVCFLEDLGSRPSKDYSLEREDFNGNYEPKNVRWALKSEQARNTRRNVFVIYRKKRLLLKDALVAAEVTPTKFYRAIRKGKTPQQIIDDINGGRSYTLPKPITFRGETHSITAWAKKLGMDKVTLFKRLRDLKWSVERALTEPVQEHMRRRKPKLSSERDRQV